MLGRVESECEVVLQCLSSARCSQNFSSIGYLARKERGAYKAIGYVEEVRGEGRQHSGGEKEREAK